MSKEDRKTGISFLWNGSKVTGQPGDSVAAALWRAGVTTLTRSRKLHRPLGYSGSYLTGVLARVDGRPNVRLDQIVVRHGMVVEMQNTWPSARFDVLRLAQLLPSKAVYGGFEHGDWMPKSGLAYRLAERVMANLAGVGRPAEISLQPQAIPGKRIAIDSLVIGGGPAGISEANRRAAKGEKVALVTRGESIARLATTMGGGVEALHPGVTLFSGMELFGIYREGALMVGAPHDHKRSAVVFEARETILATGRRSIPPLVRGNQLPGVMDVHTALQLAAVFKTMPGKQVAVVGTGAEIAVAHRLRELGVNVVHIGHVQQLQEICGRTRVNAIQASTRIACDTLIHAGPWRVDPSLGFQASGEGVFQVEARPLPGRISVVGSAALGNECISVNPNLDPETLICPCMDVTAGELYCHIDKGETDPEVLKRLTSCGMGTCQGFPCWEHMLAMLAARVGGGLESFARPTHRPPRRSITIAQAAGLAGLVEPDK